MQYEDMSVSLPSEIQRVVDAINAADTEAFVAAFTEDGQVNDWGRILTGRDGVRSWSETDAIGQKAKIDVTEATTDGDVTKLTFDWSSNRFTGSSDAYVTVRDGLVAEFRIPPAH